MTQSDLAIGFEPQALLPRTVLSDMPPRFDSTSRRARQRRSLLLREVNEESGVEGPKQKADPLAEARRPVSTAAIGSNLGSLFQILLSSSTKPSSGELSDMSRFQRLLAQMPRIAGVINQFESTEIQRDVLNALIRAFETEEGQRSSDTVDHALSDSGSSLHDESIDTHDSGFRDLMRGEPETADAENASSIHAI